MRKTIVFYLKHYQVLTLACGIIFFLPILVHAQETGFVRLVGIVDTTQEALSTEAYVNTLYRIAIGIAAFLAVAKLIFAGAKYILTDIVTDKESAKKDVRGAIVGLLIVIAAVLILNTINSQLTNFDFLRNAESINITVDDLPTVVGEEDIIGDTISIDDPNVEQFITDCEAVGTIVTTRSGNDREYTCERDSTYSTVYDQIESTSRFNLVCFGSGNAAERATCQLEKWSDAHCQGGYATLVTGGDAICREVTQGTVLQKSRIIDDYTETFLLSDYPNSEEYEAEMSDYLAKVEADFRDSCPGIVTENGDQLRCVSTDNPTDGNGDYDG